MQTSNSLFAIFLTLLLMPNIGFAAGGEDCLSATLISQLPYIDSGSTTGAINNYTGSCGGTGGAPDHVYSYIPSQNGTLDITLCGGSTDYDTKLFVIKDDCLTGTEVACSDDECANPPVFTQAWISELSAVPVVANTTYYIIIGGWSTTSSGNYTINVSFQATVGCTADFVVNAPYNSGNVSTLGTGDDCNLRASEDHIYEVSIPTIGNWTFSLCGSSYDTWLTVGTTCCSDDLGSNDDLCGLQSEIELTGLQVGNYFVQVEGYLDAGDYVLDISLSTGPANDECANAEPIACGGSSTGNTSTATIDGPSSSSPDVWYSITGNNDFMTASLCGTAFDTKIWVYDACAGTQIAYNDDGCSGSGMGGSSYASEITWTSVLGTDYKICVGGYGSNTGPFQIAVTCTTPATPPANDDCANAEAIACGDSSTGNTSTATIDGPSSSSPDVWYSITGNGQDMTASLCSSGFDTKIWVYDACAGIQVAYNDDDCGIRSEVTWTSVMSTDYKICVGGYGSNTGAYQLDVTCVTPITPPANDECTNAIAVTCGSSTAGTTIDATVGTDPIALCGTAPSAPGVWYSITGTGADLTVSTCGSSTPYDTKLNVYSGSCGSLTCIGGNDDDSGCPSYTSSFTFTSTNGTDYLIMVNGYGGVTGDFDLQVTCVSAPVNDLCANAWPLTVKTFCDPITASTEFATGVQPACAGTADDDVWFKFTAVTSQSLIEVTGSSGFDAVIELFDACGGNLLACVDDDFSLGGTEIMIANGLSSGNEYYVRVYHWFGTPPSTFEFDICVYDNAACPVPGSNWTTKIGADRARLNWMPVTSALRYQIRGKKLTNASWVIVNVDYTTPTLKDAWGLDTNETYIWQVRAICDNASNLYSAFTEFDTFMTACNMPDSNWIDPVISSAMQLNWTPVTDAYGYGMRVRLVGGANQTFTFGPGTTSKVLWGLSPGATYRWRMWAICDSLGTYESDKTPVIEVTLPTFNKLGEEEIFGEPEVHYIDFLLSPNPARDVVTIHLNGEINGKIELIDLAGQVLINKEIKKSDGFAITVNTSELASGVYQVVATGLTGKTKVKKLMLAK